MLTLAAVSNSLTGDTHYWLAPRTCKKYTWGYF